MVWVTGAGLLCSLVFSLVIFLEMREQPLKIMDAQLKTEAAAVALQLSAGQNTPDNERIKLLPVSSERYWIKAYNQDQRVAYQSGMSKVMDLPLYRNRGEDAYIVTAHVPRNLIDLHQDDEDEVAFRVRAIKTTINGLPYLIQIAKPMENLEEESSDLLAAIAIGLTVSTALLLGLSHTMTGRIVEPVATINRLARDINENSLEKRIPPGASRDEIHELADCLNRMFDRLQFSFARQKQFIADASHELKSPISMLRLFFDEATQRRDLPEAFHQLLDTQMRSVLRMDRLVKTLLELSVLEIKASLTFAPFSLTDLIRSVTADFMPLLEKEKIQIETDLPQHFDIRGDQDHIRRALINIMDNAVKYNMEYGRIRITCAEKNNNICISLYNSGPGIPKDELENVFDQFYRLEKSHSIQYGGAGLGLAIVRRIVQLHSGSVKMESVEGEWTRITIYLPIALAVATYGTLRQDDTRQAFHSTRNPT